MKSASICILALASIVTSITLMVSGCTTVSVEAKDTSQFASSDCDLFVVAKDNSVTIYRIHNKITHKDHLVMYTTNSESKVLEKIEEWEHK